ncbi:hypothetical protein N7463_008798 [Penicillium fimorum]|uniref:DRBM domain-containing protein n=1 Tax=Penicillium fimorum TaxID=1882269 RepID=A0A9X0C3R5_9EURO|nr:hypothetical protein N7463_008798 [Penicillium fimorum]
MAGLQTHHQPTDPNDILIGTILFRASVMSSLIGTGMSRDETEAHCNHAFQNFNWRGLMGSTESSGGVPQTAIEEGSARDHGIALLGQTYRVCPERQRFSIIWILADAFSHTAAGLTRHSSHGMMMGEASNSSLPSTGHSISGGTIDHIVALHRYTSVLHERGQRENKTLARIEERAITLYPPWFMVTLRYGNITCSGNARTKKEAAHLAAKEICHQLNEAI